MRESEGMIPKSGRRFSDKIMHKREGMTPKSGHRFSDKVMPKREQGLAAWA
jgi:hypothetical protein